MYREIFARQRYYFRADTEAPIILDFGANVGIAFFYFKWLYPKSHIQSFEPDPATFELLEHNIIRNKLDIEAYNYALLDEEAEVDFFIDSSNPGTLLMSIDASRLNSQPIKVRARKPSNFIRGTVDFLKLDVEGAEHRILNDLVQSRKITPIRQNGHRISPQNWSPEISSWRIPCHAGACWIRISD